MAKKRGTISGNYENEFTIIGIACNLNEYRLAHFLNKVSNFNFIRFDDFKIEHKIQDIILSFPFYYFEDIESCTTYHFISNRTAEGIIIKEWNQLDYLLIAFGAVNNNFIENIIKQIRKIPIVMAASKIPPSKNAGIENFMTDLELHIIAILKRDKEKELEIKNKLKDNRFHLMH